MDIVSGRTLSSAWREELGQTSSFVCPLSSSLSVSLPDWQWLLEGLAELRRAQAFFEDI